MIRSCIQSSFKRCYPPYPLSQQVLKQVQKRFTLAMSTEYEGEELLKAVSDKIKSFNPSLVKIEVNSRSDEMKLFIGEEEFHFQASNCSCPNSRQNFANRCTLNKVLQEIVKINKDWPL